MNQAQALDHAPAEAKASAGAHAPGEPAPKAEGDTPHETSGKYALPFAWENSAEEPLAKTRGFLRDALLDNQRQVARGPRSFKPFADKQTPRATVVTCSDSRVQSEAWDATPENDDFVIRNIGNQVSNAHGSVLYGVEHLGTPLLLVIGHTGCGAVKAAMGGKLDGLEEPIRTELAPLQLPPLGNGAENKLWADAVVANVNAQVKFAVEQLGTRIQEGKLTVVGAVYDFRNDLRGGAGKLHIVNVNANTEAERLKAFSAAVLGTPLLPSAAAKSAQHSHNHAGAHGASKLQDLLPGKSQVTSAE